MSARFYIGQSPGGHALRVMKNATDNPATTPRAQYDKFAFDSESGNLAYAYGIGAAPNINGLSYMPMVSSMARYEANWWDIYGSINIRQRNNYAAIETTDGARVTKVKASGNQYIWFGEPAAEGTVMPARPTPAETRTLVWQLQSDNSASPFPSGIGSISRFYKNSSQVRLPRPGYSITNSNVNNYILHENLSPAKVIRSGRITIPAGQTVDVTIPPEVGSNLFVGGIFGKPGDPVQIPYADFTNSASTMRRVQVRFMGGGTVRFRERDGRAAYLAYYIVAENGSGYTSGNGSFMRSFGSGSEAYFQMRRPGCAEPPNLSDILLDSRWSTMPLIDTGYVPKSGFSTATWRTASRSFTNPGYIPLAMVSWVFDYDGTEFRSTQGIAGFFAAFDPAYPMVQTITGLTRYAQLTSSNITFRHAMGSLPSGMASSNGQLYDTVFWNNSFLGVRYFIFAVPQS